MKLEPGCMAHYNGSGYTCDYCGYVWDYNDGEPPACLSEAEHSRLVKQRELDKIANKLS